MTWLRHLAVRLAAGPGRAGPAGGLGRARPRPEMVICCAAANCSNRQGKALRGAVSFHR